MSCFFIHPWIWAHVFTPCEALWSHLISSFFSLKCHDLSSIHGYGHMCLRHVKPFDLTWYHLIFLSVMILHPSMDMGTCVYTPCEEALRSHLISSYFSKCHDSSSIYGYGHMCLRNVKPFDLTWCHLIFLNVMILHPSMDMGSCVYVRWSLWRRAGLTQRGTRLNSYLTWVLYFHTTLFLRLYLTC
jgi:hypothetical protein